MLVQAILICTQEHAEAISKKEDKLYQALERQRRKRKRGDISSSTETKPVFQSTRVFKPMLVVDNSIVICDEWSEADTEKTQNTLLGRAAGQASRTGNLRNRRRRAEISDRNSTPPIIPDRTTRNKLCNNHEVSLKIDKPEKAAMNTTSSKTSPVASTASATHEQTGETFVGANISIPMAEIEERHREMAISTFCMCCGDPTLYRQTKGGSNNFVLCSDCRGLSPKDKFGEE
mmetsp:Transcript_20451/g.30728  ORF Transcript_20451/g.30728 Transcript_20451/m.30728 type:complete len:232 (-) Transcript_20451:212-907(-)